MPNGISNIINMAKSKNDLGITNDDIQKTKDYKEALDQLRSSLTGVNSALPKFSDGLETGLKGLAEKLPEVVESMTKLNLQNKELIANGQKPVSIFSQLTTSLLSWNNLVSVGITLLTTYGETIINWVAGMIKGETTLNALGRAIRDNTILQNALIQTKLQASKSAQTEITDLNALYRAAQDHTRSLADKKDIIQALKDQWPNTFKGLRDEEIATGKAANAYKALKEQILAAAMAEAAKNKITSNYGRILENNEKINRERASNLMIIENQKKAQDKLDGYKSFLGDQGANAKLLNKAVETQTKLRAASDRLIYDTFTDNQRLNTQIERFYQEIDKSVQKYGPGIVGHKPNQEVNSNGSTITIGKLAEAVKTDNNIKPREEIQFEDVRPDTSAVKTSLDKSAEQSLEAQKNVLVNKTIETQRVITGIEVKSAKERAEAEEQSVKSKIHAGDKFIDAALKNSKKDSAIFKTAFLAKKATSIADTIISTKQAVMESFKAYASIPFIGQALGIAQAIFMGAQGASSIAEIAKQKPGFAEGGQFRSDGRGALLPGYSRTDNTNAYLRSGEAVVVSEAMRNPWARNLVSAINVAHGGRDFSVTNPCRGYAIGGIFTDGGNSNRYYNQPMNDVKDLANTLAYQMINNFPPVYVDVKDINSQQSILAQTVNRVNL